MMKGVFGVTARPESSALPKPRTYAIRSPWTMPSASPGIRCAAISSWTKRSMAAYCGSGAVPVGGGCVRARAGRELGCAEDQRGEDRPARATFR